MSNLEKIKRFLELLRETMQEVAEENKELDMGKWFVESTKIDKYTTVHTCNTPACAAGYASLNSEIIELINLEGEDPDKRAFSVDYWLEVISKRTSFPRLNDVLFCYCEVERHRHFKRLFPHISPDGFKHLATEDPTPNDVIELIDFLIPEVEKEIQRETTE